MLFEKLYPASPSQRPLCSCCSDKFQGGVITLWHGFHPLWFQHVLCQVAVKVQYKEGVNN